MPIKQYKIASMMVFAAALAFSQPGSAAAEEPGAEANGKATTPPRSDEAETPSEDDKSVTMTDSIPWKEISSLDELEQHLADKAQSLAVDGVIDKFVIKKYLENSGFRVTLIPTSVGFRLADGSYEPGVIVSGAIDPSEIDGPLGRWWNRLFAHGMGVSVVLTDSGKLARTQAGYNFT